MGVFYIYNKTKLSKFTEARVMVFPNIIFNNSINKKLILCYILDNIVSISFKFLVGNENKSYKKSF